MAEFRYIIYELDGYKSIHLARPLRQGGGVSLYIFVDIMTIQKNPK